MCVITFSVSSLFACVYVPWHDLDRALGLPLCCLRKCFPVFSICLWTHVFLLAHLREDNAHWCESTRSSRGWPDYATIAFQHVSLYCMSPSMSGCFCLFFSWPLKSLLPQPVLPVESQMESGLVDVVCQACNLWPFASSFYFPPWAWKGETQTAPPALLSALCAVIPPLLIPFNHLPMFSCSFTFRTSSSTTVWYFTSLFQFSVSLQQIKMLTSTTPASATCPTWQQEALFPCMFWKWVKTRWVHKVLI